MAIKGNQSRRKKSSKSIRYGILALIILLAWNNVKSFRENNNWMKEVIISTNYKVVSPPKEFERSAPSTVHNHETANNLGRKTFLQGEQPAVKTPFSYIVCNGLTNQLLGHAGFIASAIESGKDILLPDTFITNGVQNKKESKYRLKNTLATRDNSIPLSNVIHMPFLLEKIKSYGVNAHIEPYETALEHYNKTQSCDWISTLQNQRMKEILQAIKSSKKVSKVIGINKSSLIARIHSFNATLSL